MRPLISGLARSTGARVCGPVASRSTWSSCSSAPPASSAPCRLNTLQNRILRPGFACTRSFSSDQDGKPSPEVLERYRREHFASGGTKEHWDWRIMWDPILNGHRSKPLVPVADLGKREGIQVVWSLEKNQPIPDPLYEPLSKGSTAYATGPGPVLARHLFLTEGIDERDEREQVRHIVKAVHGADPPDRHLEAFPTTRLKRTSMADYDYQVYESIGSKEDQEQAEAAEARASLNPITQFFAMKDDPASRKLVLNVPAHCVFCAKTTPETRRLESNIRPTNVRLLNTFLNARGQILPRRLSGACNAHQNMVRDSVLHSRQLGLLPYLGKLYFKPGAFPRDSREIVLRTAGSEAQELVVRKGLASRSLPSPASLPEARRFAGLRPGDQDEIIDSLEKETSKLEAQIQALS